MISPTQDDIPRIFLDEDPDAGFTYVIGRSGHYKIGHSKDVRRRLHELQIAHHKKLSLFCFWVTCCPKAIEEELHLHFAKKLVRGEWYKLNQHDLRVLRNWAKSNTVPTFLLST